MNQNSVRSLRVILTGSTGMVGEGVLHECLQHPAVERVLVINRRECGIIHPKLIEIIHNDFMNMSEIQDRLTNYNACFFCLGVSSIGLKEDEYSPLTYDLTMHLAKILSFANNNMTFCYISGAGTDSTEKGRLMWARVKGKTENHLMKLPFKKVYNFRPAVLTPTKGLKNTLKPYKYFGWLIPLFKKVIPKYICSLRELGVAMINVCLFGFEKNFIEVPDIIDLAKKENQN